MKPQRMPCVIEKVRGMRTIVRNAGSASSIRESSRCATLLNMSAPTTMRTGAVANAGTISAAGAMKKHGRKHSAVKTDVSPVRPPISMPAALSMYAVPDDVPASPAPSVASASTMRPSLRFLGSPLESKRPQACETPTKVESESNRSVMRIATTAGQSFGESAPRTRRRTAASRVEAHQERHREAQEHGRRQRAGERHAGAGGGQDRGV